MSYPYPFDRALKLGVGVLLSVQNRTASEKTVRQQGEFRPKAIRRLLDGLRRQWTRSQTLKYSIKSQLSDNGENSCAFSLKCKNPTYTQHVDLGNRVPRFAPYDRLRIAQTIEETR